MEGKTDWTGAKEVEQFDLLMQYIRSSPTDKDFMIGLISHLVPNCEIFRKTYRPPIADRPLAQALMVENKNGFFDNLTPLSSKELKQKGSLSMHVYTKMEKA